MITILGWLGFIYICIVCASIVREVLYGKRGFNKELAVAFYTRGLLVIMGLLMILAAFITIFMGQIAPEDILNQVEKINYTKE